MYKVNEIKELIRTLDQSSIDELTIKGDGDQLLSLRRNKVIQTELLGNVQIEQASETQVIPSVLKQTNQHKASKEVELQKHTLIEEAEIHVITSPMVGTFYESPSPDEAPFVKVGDQVSAEKVVCIVEAMKLMNELEADIEGEIVTVLVKNGDLVEYGQSLFEVKKNT